MIQDDWDAIVSLPKRTAQDVQKEILKEKNESPLSLSALGLLLNLCSYPPTWELHKTELYERFGQDGERAVKTAWNDLIDKRYIVEYRYRSGKKWEYVYHYRRVPYSPEEKAKILDTAAKEYSGIWGLQNADLKMKTSKRRGNQDLLLNKTFNKTNINNNKEYIDDDKRTEGPAIHNDEQINLIISNLREVISDDLSDRSYSAVVRKVVNKYNQGAIGEGKFRDYLVAALANKIEELELRRQKDKTKQQLDQSKKQRMVDRLNSVEIKRNVPKYDWLNAQ